jgi:glutaredoxin
VARFRKLTGLATFIVLFAGCDAVAKSVEGLATWIEEPEGDPEPDQEATLVDALADAEELPERPADSIARTETDVITFRDILEDEEMTREQRIEALLNLDPAALQNPRTRGAGEPGEAGGGDQAPTSLELAAARRRVPVVMYSTTWCGVCKRARRYFERERISFVEYDVDRNTSARAEYLRLNPRRSVPTIKIGDEVIVGFSEQSVEHALDTAARARLN